MAREIQKFQVSIKGFITKDDELLLVKSGNGREELWELPGGRYDVGEEEILPEAILQREIKEELGSDFRCRIAKPAHAWIRPLNDHFVFLVGYDCKYESGTIKISSEHTEYQWVTKVSWRDLPLAPGYAEALDQFWKNR